MVVISVPVLCPQVTTFGCLAEGEGERGHEREWGLVCVCVCVCVCDSKRERDEADMVVRSFPVLCPKVTAFGYQGNRERESAKETHIPLHTKQKI